MQRFIEKIERVLMITVISVTCLFVKCYLSLLPCYECLVRCVSKMQYVCVDVCAGFRSITFWSCASSCGLFCRQRRVRVFCTGRSFTLSWSAGRRLVSTYLSSVDHLLVKWPSRPTMYGGCTLHCITRGWWEQWMLHRQRCSQDQLSSNWKWQ